MSSPRRVKNRRQIQPSDRPLSQPKEAKSNQPRNRPLVQLKKPKLNLPRNQRFSLRQRRQNPAMTATRQSKTALPLNPPAKVEIQEHPILVGRTVAALKTILRGIESSS